MADILTYTQQPIRVTSAGVVQPLHTAIDVLPYDFLDLEIGVVGYEGSVSAPQLGIAITTGLQTECEDGWMITWVGLFTPSAPWQTHTFSGNFLRYSRWITFSANWGTQSAAEIFIRGVGRRRGEP